jgi:uncharacterized coiled-coil protein SlyX
MARDPAVELELRVATLEGRLDELVPAIASEVAAAVGANSNAQVIDYAALVERVRKLDDRIERLGHVVAELHGVVDLTGARVSELAVQWSNLQERVDALETAR